MRKLVILTALVVCISLVGGVFAAPAIKYVDAPPLSQAINTQVGEVKTGGPVQLPLITWGGDIATIYANGNSRTTVKGSIFEKEGLNFKLFREDDFKKQVEMYMRGETPYLRGTMGMINMAVEVLHRDPRTRPVVVYQMTESNGGDTLTVRAFDVKGNPYIRTAKDLKGKTIAVQAYGPHVDYLGKILADAGLSLKDVTIKWTKDLTGTDDTPAAALRNDKSVDAAMVIIPDATELTSGGVVGTGAEKSVKGAKILLTTKTANRIIADVYAVRADYFQAHRVEVEKFFHGLLIAEESLRGLVKNKSSRAVEYKKAFTAVADILLDSDKAVADAEGLYGDAEFVGYRGNVKFFGDPNYLRNFDKRTAEIQNAFAAIGLLSKRTSLDHAKWDYNRLKAGLSDVAGVEAPKFEKDEVAKVIDKKQKQGTLTEGELFSFEVYFQPNQNSFPFESYAESFAKVVDLAATYGGAVITVEGHSDPLGYLKSKKSGESDVVLSRTRQAAKNLSMARANAVRDSVIAYARKRGITVDASQFVVVGHGIDKARNGMCGNDPCAPKTEQEWRNNMRVEFRIIQIEAESSAFKPL